jgi:DNA-binding FadR family transcriptional regulator
MVMFMQETTAAPRPHSKAPSSTIEAVFEAIVGDIVRGVYAPGARLPAERELARALVASRPTLREALRRLTEWLLIEPRRGSGIVVRSPSEWSIEVLPAVLRHARPGPGEPTMAEVFGDLLALRRSMMVEILRIIAPRVPAGGTREARSAMARAWAARGQPAAFQREDLAVFRGLVEAARFYPALWLLNRLAEVYLEIGGALPMLITAPADYVDVNEQVLDALEQGEGAAAVTALDGYLARHDRRLMTLLERHP